MSPVDELRAALERTLPAEWMAAVRSEDRERLDEVLDGTDRGTIDGYVRQIAADGWLVPEWPRELGGRALDADATVDVRRELARWRVGTVDSAIGTGWVGPAILRFGDATVARELLPAIARNETLWCQLFSEPDAGSDLASVRTKATPDGEHWRVNGRKTWTSRADRAQWGLAVTRTDIDVPKHAGLTCFLVDMTSPGVTIEPIRQMTGDSEFFQVTLDDVAIADRYRLGARGQGWEVVRTVLQWERLAGSGAGAATPGSMVGRSIEELVAAFLSGADDVAADRIAQLWVESRAIAFNNRRHALHRAADLPPVAGGTPYNKVMQAEHTKRLQRAFLEFGGMSLLAHGLDDRAAAYDVWAFLRVQPKTVAGGTSEVLRDQIAERGLSMPRGTDPSRGQTWRSFLESPGANT
ncbi:acyl-CoA dehydrogenase family protein [Nocardia callitridis]|uniref:Acyl-CoA dehydrogenase n=1 Tax=Nocardia callitridis TaxID=648753 RepID=A0ABP9KPN2_9NOCA